MTTEKILLLTLITNPLFTGNPDLAAEILKELDLLVPGIAIVKLRRINVERRQGHLENACMIYKEAMDETGDEEARSFYAIRYARFLAKVC